MPVPTITADRGPMVHISATFQRLTDMFAAQPSTQARDSRQAPRSVADLLEFGYVVTGADHHFPHKAA